MVDKFLDYLKYEKNFSDHTIINYRIDLEEFYNYLNGKKINTIDVNFVREYLKELYNKKYSSSSISRKVSSLKSYFKYLEAENKIKTNPMTLISNPKKEKKLPNFLNYNDLEKLLNTPDKNTEEGIRDTLILEMLYSTGIRVSELVNIQIKNINTYEHKILVLGKGNKERYVYYGTKCQKGWGKVNKERYVYYGTKCQKILDDYLKIRKANTNYLLVNKHGNKLNERTVRKIIEETTKKAGINVHVTPHVLRHTYATHMLNEGADLKSVGDLLGHENLSTTQIYTHVSNERLRNVYLNSHPRAKK